LLFEKIEDDAIEAQLKRLEDIRKANEEAKSKEEASHYKAAPQKEEVPFDVFEKLDLRVGTVLTCERVPKTDKLLRFTIDDGLGSRTIISGLAQYYDPESLVGTQVVFVANLEPRTMRGIESRGMLLTTQDADGSVRLLRPEVAVTAGIKIS